MIDGSGRVVLLEAWSQYAAFGPTVELCYAFLSRSQESNNESYERLARSAKLRNVS